MLLQFHDFRQLAGKHRPQLSDEIEAAVDRLHEIEKAAGKVEKLWNLGNHDTRFESRLALIAPEYARIKGVSHRGSLPQLASSMGNMDKQ